MAQVKLSPQQNKWLASGILQKWHDKTWDTFTNDAAAKKLLRDYVKRHEEVRRDGTGLFLYGANGTGKTLCLNLVMKDLHKLGYTVRVISLPTLITQFTAGWYDKTEKRDFQKMLQTVDFLGIEEIGKEFKAGANELGVMVLDNVVRYRLQMQRPILATSNTGPKDIKSVYTEDIASMLREFCLPLNVQGEDFRIRIAERNKKKYGWQ